MAWEKAEWRALQAMMLREMFGRRLAARKGDRGMLDANSERPLFAYSHHFQTDLSVLFPIIAGWRRKRGVGDSRSLGTCRIYPSRLVAPFSLFVAVVHGYD